MKTLIILIGLIAGSVIPRQAVAQINIHVNMGLQPVWGPAGYSYVQYYYLPDIEAYYDVPAHQFIYLSNGRWVYSYGLPYRYRYYNLYTGYKVVINSPRPYMNFYSHRVIYGKYKGYYGRQMIMQPYHRPGYETVYRPGVMHPGYHASAGWHGGGQGHGRHR